MDHRRIPPWLSIPGQALLVAACGSGAGLAPSVSNPTLVNDDFEIVEMAAAHGAFTIEVEVSGGADRDAIARRLVEPLQANYAEILVYFFDRDRDGEALPISRIQWTASDGFREIEYPARERPRQR